MQLVSFTSCLLVAAASASAQVLAREEKFDRRMTRVTWVGMSGQQRVAVEYGPAKWRPEYEGMLSVKEAAQFPLGAGAWTTWHSTVDVAAGGVRIPHGLWYVGLDRDATAAWSLAMVRADEVDAGGHYVGASLAHPEVRLPMTLAANAPSADVLEITLAVDKKTKRDVALTLAWGTFRLSTKLVAAIDERVQPGTPEFALSPKDKVVTTRSGLQYEVLQAGAGDAPKATDEVTVHYAGWLTDGTLFDTSYHRKEPSTFPMQSVVKGFAEGLQLMRPGATYRLTIPPELAYGDRDLADIPPNSTLVFVVSLLGVRK